MKVQGVGLIGFNPSAFERTFPKFKSNDFDPDVSLERQGNNYKYVSKSEQKRKQEIVKKKKQEIAMIKRKNILSNATNLLGQQIFNKILSKHRSEDMLKTNNSARSQNKKESNEIKQPETSRVPGTSKNSLLSRNGDLLRQDNRLHSVREKNNIVLSNKLIKNEAKNAELRRSDEKLKKILRNWGKSKAKREENWLLKQSNGQVFNNKINKVKSTVPIIATPSVLVANKEFDSDTTLSNGEDSDVSYQHSNYKSRDASRPAADQSKLPVLPKKKFTKQPNVIDFASNVDEMNANQFDEYGQPHFDVCLDSSKSLSASPARAQQSRMRSYFDHKLWCHMTDFRNDGKTKISIIRNKYPWTKLK